MLLFDCFFFCSWELDVSLMDNKSLVAGLVHFSLIFYPQSLNTWKWFLCSLLSSSNDYISGLFYVYPFYLYVSRVTYSDLCLQIPESKFRQCLLMTLGILFKLLCSYFAIMSYQPERKVILLHWFFWLFVYIS